MPETSPITRRLAWPIKGRPEDAERLLDREWLATNGLGGYSSGTVSWISSRRYHGLLVAALPAPFGRIVMLTDMIEELRLDDGTLLTIGGHDPYSLKEGIPGANVIAEFRLDMGQPVWRYEVGGGVVEKRLVMPHMQNTVYITYKLVERGSLARIRLFPYFNFRPIEAPVDGGLKEPYGVTALGKRYEIHEPGSGLLPLRMHFHGSRVPLVLDEGNFREVFYLAEQCRGYDCHGRLWSPGYFRIDFQDLPEVTFVASTEEWSSIFALDPGRARDFESLRLARLLTRSHPETRQGLGAELTLAADQFIITPSTRREDKVRANAQGDEVRTIIAGYHWFTDWGRDTMISLEGLTLVTGRRREAGYILREFAIHVKDGLIPNMFPEGELEGLYHTADATLWFFHALDRYLAHTGDKLTLRLLLPTLREIVSRHEHGTRFGIRMDSDGLITQGQAGYQLTWMDAKVDNWVVTPRRGKAVEINALWYNALLLMADWLAQEGEPDESERLLRLAARTRESFNRRFWYAQGSYLFDVVDGEQGDDPSLRPNQLFAISLPNPVLDQARFALVLEAVERELLTPHGLRSLSPSHPDYKTRYYGDLRSRDAAYHQGTVWGWLIGPFIDAWLKVHPGDLMGARRFLDGFEAHLNEGGIGSISEVFDADSPFIARGCIAQAWSVAEVLRSLANTTSPAKPSGQDDED